MEMWRFQQREGGRFLTALALAYALILQLLLPPAIAAAAQWTDAAICLPPVTSNAPDAPLKHHGDGLCQSHCAALTTDAKPEPSFELVVLFHAKRVVFAFRGAETHHVHVWKGVRARGPPVTV